jgi:exonuclease VII small subunit
MPTSPKAPNAKTPPSFEQQYPSIDRFTHEIGWVEIGQDEVISAFVRAIDLIGLVYEGQDSYPTLEAALQDLDQGIET